MKLNFTIVHRHENFWLNACQGGSKEIPRKNFPIVGENSLIPIEILQTKAINCRGIWGSIEDLEIADFAGYADVLIHAMESLELTPESFR